MLADIWQEGYDADTGMATRPLFLEHVNHALRRLGRSALTMAVLCTRAEDLEPADAANPSDTERARLVEAAHRLQTGLREGDVAARIGDTSFAVLCEDLESYDHAIGVAVRLIDEMDRPLVVEGEVVPLDLRFGVAFPLPEDDDGRAILDRSLAAMRAARMNPEARYDVILGSATPDADAAGER